ncbi:hypothetical protein BH09SUM1_BH09SUM1_31070 [soil metagenome]
MSGAISMVVFESAGVDFVVPSARVSAVMEAGRIHPVPRARKGVVGFFVHGDRLIPVVEIAPGSLKAMTAVILVGFPDPVAVPSTSIRGVKDIPADSISPLDEAMPWVVANAWFDGKKVAVLSPALLNSVSSGNELAEAQPKP